MSGDPDYLQDLPDLHVRRDVDLEGHGEFHRFIHTREATLHRVTGTSSLRGESLTILGEGFMVDLPQLPTLVIENP